MSNQITNQMQSLLASAAKKLPAKSAEMDQARHRYSAASDARVILADVSGSMDGLAWGGRRKIDLLAEAVVEIVRGDLDWGDLSVIAFSDCSHSHKTGMIRSAGFPANASGGTAMHLGLDEAAKAYPRHTLVISDGNPDNEQLAMAAAERLTGVIDVLYIGPDSDKVAIAFMRRLARVGAGRVVVNDVCRSGPQLSQAIRGLLPG